MLPAYRKKKQNIPPQAVEAHISEISEPATEEGGLEEEGEEPDESMGKKKVGDPPLTGQRGGRGASRNETESHRKNARKEKPRYKRKDIGQKRTKEKQNATR